MAKILIAQRNQRFLVPEPKSNVLGPRSAKKRFFGMLCISLQFPFCLLYLSVYARINDGYFELFNTTSDHKPLYTSDLLNSHLEEDIPMSERKGGSRRKSRHKFMKPARTKGKVSLTKYLQEFSVGENVHLIVESSVHEGIYHPRFHGKQGEITGKQGACYYVQIRDGGKKKKLLVHPVHLTKVIYGQTTTT